jgi:hypothetical protein
VRGGDEAPIPMVRGPTIRRRSNVVGRRAAESII